MGEVPPIQNPVCEMLITVRDLLFNVKVPREFMIAGSRNISAVYIYSEVRKEKKMRGAD